MAISGVRQTKGIAGTASECLAHAVEAFGDNAIRRALRNFADVDAAVVGSLLAGDIQPGSKFTPILYVALDLLSYDVQEFKDLDDKRRTILQAYAFGAITAKELMEDLRLNRWPDVCRSLLNVNQTGIDRKLEELADDLRSEVIAELVLRRERLVLHVMLLHAQAQLREASAAESPTSATSQACTAPPAEPSPVTSTEVASQADDPRFATAVARLIQTLLVMLAMQPDRHQLLVRSRLGKDLQDLIKMLQEALAPPAAVEVAEPLGSDDPSATEEAVAPADQGTSPEADATTTEEVTQS